jgi:hypothetical protein
LRELGPCTLHRKTFLEQWFGTEGLRNSTTFINFQQQLHDCTDCAPVHQLLDSLGPLKTSLPKTEWSQLHQSAHSALARLSAPR